MATGAQVVLLNNDTIVTTGWLTRLLRALSSDMQVGLVGPCSNRISGEQQVDVSYGEDLSRLDPFAWDWGQRHDGKREETDRLVGFCLMIRREVIDRIGFLDERFGVGCFEDDDYCLRARRAGFRLVIARDAFVHHFAGRTFIGTETDFAGLMERNRQIFLEKWQEAEQAEDPTPNASSVAKVCYSCRPQPGGGLLLVRESVELSLCMIVRDNAPTIRACLESIRPWVDEMVVVDTGSRDETPRIAAEVGARVFHFTWCDDFSAARNESLRHARGRWIFWMDSDDTISAECGRKLRETIARATPQSFGFVCQVHCPGPGDGEEVEVTVVDHLKLFRNLPGVHFEHRIHEQVLPSITKEGGCIEFTDIYVVHSGYDHSPEGQERKLERDLRLLHKELEERPEHTFTLFNLGMTYTHVRRYEEALGYLRRSLASAGEQDSHLRKAYSYLVTCHQGLGQTREAWDVCWQGLSRFPDDAELRFRRGILLHQEQRLAEAAEAYQELLRRREGDHFKSVVAGLHGYMTRHNLALIYQEMGEYARAEEQWRLVVGERAGYRPGWRGLGACLVSQGKQSEIRALAESLLQNERLRVEGMLMRGQVAASEGDLASACDYWQRVVVEAANEKDVLELVCRLLFEKAGPAKAESALEALLRCDLTNAMAHHNLGLVYLSTGRASRAVDAFRESLKHRPAMVATLFQLGQALEASGQMQAAIRTWEEVLRINPQDKDAQEALRRVRQSGMTGGTGSPKAPEPGVPATETVYPLRLGAKESRVRLVTRGAVDRAIVRDLWERDVYGVREIRESPRTVIDIGAHIGTFSILVSEAWPDARVIACEADPENCLLLQRNLRGRQNVEVVEAAVVAEDVSEVGFNSVADKALYNSGGGSCVRKEPGCIWKRVPAISVAKLWEAKRIEICDLLKLDCEGAEVSLRQALSTASYLSKVRRIVGEWHALDRISRDGKGVRAQLMDILQATHEVLFRSPLDGSEGHFVAVPR